MLLYNGLVYSKGVFYKAIVTEKDKIAFIGSDTEATEYAKNKGDNNKINLKGKLVLPGFIDSHAHGGTFLAMAKNKIDLSNGKNVEEYIDIIRCFITTHTEMTFYRGIGWSSPCFDENGPRKELLDDICAEKPIVIKSLEGHSLWVNSKAMELAGVREDTNNPQGGIIARNADGSIRGVFLDQAQNLIDAITPDDTVGVYKEAILEYQNLMVKYGYTSTAEMMMEKNSNLHKAYKELAEEGKLLIKTLLAYWVKPQESKSILQRLQGRKEVLKNKLVEGRYVKIFIDGVVEGATAWLKEPYSNQPDFYGEPLWDEDSLFHTCAELDMMGYDIHFHVIGDRAVEQMIAAVNYVIRINGKKPRRPVAAHVQLISPEDIDKMKVAGISVSANPYWFFKDKMYTMLNELPMLGKRVDRQFPMKSLVDNGIVVSTGSDFAITENPDPLMAIRFGMERTAADAEIGDKSTQLNEKECVDFDTMLDSVTINGAYTMALESYTGSLEVGKLADMTVLDKNLFEVKTSDYKKINVDMTISEGEIVYERF